MNMIKDWRDRDYIWLITILIGIILLLLAFKLNQNDNVVNIITLLSSGSSIGLAVIAIVQSTIYNAASNDLYSRMTEKLNALENGVDIIKSSVIKDVKEAIDESSIDEEEKEELKFKLSDIISNDRNDSKLKMAGYLIEKIVYNKLMQIYSQNSSYTIYDSYNLNSDRGIDIIIESKDKSQSILIEVKNIIDINRPFIINKAVKSLKTYVENYKKRNDIKELIAILLVVSNEKIPYVYNYDQVGIKVVNITEKELINSNKNQFKEMLGIEL